MTTEKLIYKLNFESSVHFGNKRLTDSESTIMADTLFSALIIEAIQLKFNINELLENITLSNTFPFQEDTYYLPKPLIKVQSNEKDDNYKIFKKLKYIPSDYYKEYVNGKIDSNSAEWFILDFNIGTHMLQTKVSLLNQEVGLTKDSEPYSVGTFKFNDGCGLYFIAEGNKESLKVLNNLMTSLQFSGLGGKRSAGYGRFNFEVVNSHPMLEVINNKDLPHQVLISNAMAKDEELTTVCDDARYTLAKRSGFIQSDSFSTMLVKKRNFYTFNAGSVFTNTFDGQIIDVGEIGAHPVYRYAKAMWLGVS